MLFPSEPQRFDRPAARRLLQGLQGTVVLGPAYAPFSLPSSDGSAVPPTQSQIQQDSSPKFSLTVNHFNPSIVTVMVILLFAFFFMGFLSLYVVRCRRRSTGLSLRRSAEALVEGSSQGLDPYILRGVPLIAHSSAKKKGNNVECVVCLMEFEEQEPLRQLPGCKHVFHPDCIDMWLYSHSTCPLCRRKIGVPSGGGLSFRWGSGSFRHLPFLSRGASGVPNNEPPAGSEEAARTPLVESGTRLHIQTSRSAGVDIYRSASAEISNLTGFDRRPWDTSSIAVNEATAGMNREGHGQASADTNESGLRLARANSTGHSLAKCGSS